MNGKELKVAEYDLTFGANARIVKVLGLFRYLKNNNLYVIYTDNNPTQPVINYGSSHIKEDTILSMTPKKEDEEIIKEYIFKVTSGEELKDFEIISLDKIENIELISSNHLEIKKEVLDSLIDKTIPKKETEEEKNIEKNSKQKKKKSLAPLLIIVALAIGAYYIYTTIITEKDNTIKSFTCKKEASNQTINATIATENIYNFNNQDILENIETTQTYTFISTEAYQDFINKGLIYKYMPDENNGGYKTDEENNTMIYVSKIAVDENYTESRAYEEILSQAKNEGFTCEEKILE